MGFITSFFIFKKILRTGLFPIALLVAVNVSAQVANYGNLYIHPGTEIAVADSFANAAGASFQNNGTMRVRGNFINNQPAMAAGTGQLLLEGSAAQTVGGSQPLYTNQFVVSKSGQLSLDQNIYIGGGLTLNNGIVNTAAGKMLILEPGATISGTPGIAAFVNGPVTWQSNAAGSLTLPLGVSQPAAIYQPVTIVAEGPNGITSFTAEYKNANPAAAPYGGTLAPLAAGILNNRYWVITKNGNGSGRVALNYSNPGSGFWTPTSPSANSNVAVLQWQPTPGYWKFTGDANDLTDDGPTPETMPYTQAGQLYSTKIAESDRFTAFAIGFQNLVVLPFHLLTFDATLLGSNTGQLTWSVANDGSLAGFELLHSTIGSNFVSVASLAPLAGTQTYSFRHLQLATGRHYYQLLLKDKDGSSKYSAVKTLDVGRQLSYIKGLQQSLVRSSVTPVVFSASEQAATVVLVDAGGKMLTKKQEKLAKGFNNLTMQTSQLPAGIYFIQLITQDGVKGSLRFVKE